MNDEDVFLSKTGTLAALRVDQLWLSATGDRPLDDPSWSEMLDFLSATVKRDGPVTATLNWCPTQATTNAQRQLMMSKPYAESLRIDLTRRSAIITDSVLIRGTLTAIGWLTNGKMQTQGFSRDKLAEAFTWVAEGCHFDRPVAERRQQEIVALVRSA